MVLAVLWRKTLRTVGKNTILRVKIGKNEYEDINYMYMILKEKGPTFNNVRPLKTHLFKLFQSNLIPKR